MTTWGIGEEDPDFEARIFTWDIVSTASPMDRFGEVLRNWGGGGVGRLKQVVNELLWNQRFGQSDTLLGQSQLIRILELKWDGVELSITLFSTVYHIETFPPTF